MSVLGFILFWVLFAIFRPTVGYYYCKISNYHTLCRFPGPSARCGKVYSEGLTNQEKAFVVHAHNELRGAVAKGRTIQPPAANMMQMYWDDELAAIAQRWASQCQYGHDCASCRKTSRFEVGQNVYLSIGGILDRNDWSHPIKAWFHDEINLFPTSHVFPFVFQSRTGHYSQMVWAETNRVGCGVTAYNHYGSTGRLYVCNYGPAGNINIPGRSRVYQIGNSCSRCPYYSGCSKNYPGLCF